MGMAPSEDASSASATRAEKDSGAAVKHQKTAILTPLQVREAIIVWARSNGLVEPEEDVNWENVVIRQNGSAAIKRFNEQP